jgi:N-acyl-D-amino-acid deacylase
MSNNLVLWSAFVVGLLLPANVPDVWAASDATAHDLVIRNGLIYDGSGGKPYKGIVAINGDRIVYVGPPSTMTGRTEIDARGQAVTPGFIDMLSHSRETLLVDYRAVSDITQGVTLQLIGEFSFGPLTAEMKQDWMDGQRDSKFYINWTTLGEYLNELERRGIAPNVASFVSVQQIREYVLGDGDVQPTEQQLGEMKMLARQAMEQGAVGVTVALLYTPALYAKTQELIELAKEAGQCGGMFTIHVRSEGDRVEESIQEAIAIAKGSGTPTEIYHLKTAGRNNWSKMDRVVEMIEQARAAAPRVSANMYAYTAAATGLNTTMPPWFWDRLVQSWTGEPISDEERAKGIAAMREQNPKGWENWLNYAGPDGVVLLGPRNPAMRPLIGMTIAEIAQKWRRTPEETIVELVINDKSRVDAAFFLMDEANVARVMSRPWVSFGADYGALAPEGVFKLTSAHPRAYGNFARVFAKYVREDHLLTVEEAVRRMTSLPADNLSLWDRGRLRGLSRWLLNLAERGGSRVYPQVA